MRVFLPNNRLPKPGKPSSRPRALKRTKARDLVHQLLQKALSEESHLNAEALYQRALLTDDSLSLATIYRVLADFEQLGLVQVHVFRDMRKVYELEAGQPQDHLVNLDTGEITHLPSQVIEACCAALAEQRGVEAVRPSMTLYVRGAPDSPGAASKSIPINSL